MGEPKEQAKASDAMQVPDVIYSPVAKTTGEPEKAQPSGTVSSASTESQTIQQTDAESTVTVQQQEEAAK